MSELRRLKQPFDPVIDKDSRVLIIGTFPSVKAIENGYYYGNPHNRFYNVLGALLETDLYGLDWQGKKTALLKKHVAIYDVIQSCSVVGSGDATIRDVVPVDIETIIKNTAIAHIFINGQTAGKIFDKHFPHLEKMRTILPSTSPANAKMSLEALMKAWRPLLRYL